MPTHGERVSARMNLNTGQIIVKRRNSQHGEYGETLIQTSHLVELKGVEFHVQEKAHEKVVDQGSRDVCAYAVGNYVGTYVDMDPSELNHQPIAYNPFRCKHFHMPETDERQRIPVESAEKLFLWTEKVDGDRKGRMQAFRPYPLNL